LLHAFKATNNAAKMIIWDALLDNANTAVFAILIDGTDFRIWEQKYPQLPRDNGQCSKKFNHNAAKYQVALSVFQAKYVFTSVVPTEEGCMPWWSFTRVV
jgi:hypothetical protein